MCCLRDSSGESGEVCSMCVCGDTGSGWVGGGSDIKFFAKAMETMCSPGTIASPRVLGCLKCPRGLDSISAGSQNKMNTIQVDIKLKVCMVCMGLLENNRHAVEPCVKCWSRTVTLLPYNLNRYYQGKRLAVLLLLITRLPSSGSGWPHPFGSLLPFHYKWCRSRHLETRLKPNLLDQ